MQGHGRLSAGHVRRGEGVDVAVGDHARWRGRLRHDRRDLNFHRRLARRIAECSRVKADRDLSIVGKGTRCASELPSVSGIAVTPPVGAWLLAASFGGGDTQR